MTFSQSVKEELLLINIEKKTAKLELIAVFKSLGNLVQSSDSLSIEIKTTQIKLARRILQILHYDYPNAQTQTKVRTNNLFQKNLKEHIVIISSHVEEILLDLNLIDKKTNFILSFNDVDFSKYNSYDLGYYALIYFCSTGSINDPRISGQYHLEIRGNNKEYLTEIINMTKEYDINFKITTRKNSHSLYLNKAEEIADFMKFMHALDTLLEFEDFRITRDNNLMYNRLNNADIANEMKQIKSSSQQINAINYLKENDKFDELSEKQKVVANLRLQFPDDSLSQLSEKSEDNISKSNISHHLRNIVKRVPNDL